MNDNTIAILLATYNGAAYLEEQLQSIENQVYDKWYLIVSDDGSSDATCSIIADFAKQHPGRVEITIHDVAQSNSCINFFYLMNVAKERFSYYSFCDQDDFWKPNKLQLAIDKMKALERTNTPATPILVFSDAEVVDEKLERISPSFIQYTGVSPDRTSINNLLVQNPISGAGMMMNNALLKLSAVGENLEGIDMHDQWVGLVASVFGQVAYIDDASYLYRQHGNNVSGAVEMSFKTIIKKCEIAKKSLKTKQRQARRFVDAYKDCEQISAYTVELITGFASLSKSKKIKRIRFCFENGIFMNGTVRNIGLLVFV